MTVVAPYEPPRKAGINEQLHILSRLELGVLDTSAGCARGHTRNVLRTAGFAAELTDDAELVASELVTNAVQASRRTPGTPPVLLRLLAGTNVLVVEVWDMSPEEVIEPSDDDTGEESGRGLMIVAALSTRWGSQRVSAAEKVVYAVFGGS